MEPNKFRESRQAINRMCANIDVLIGQKDLENSRECHEEVSSKLDILTPLAEGEIQERSVKNLSVKLRGLSTLIAKLKPKKKPRKPGEKVIKILINWDEERVGQLSPVFLKKLYENMKNDADSQVYFGRTGKGIRPSYQIEYGNTDTTTFSGSGHKPVKKSLSTASTKRSDPFSHEIIGSILKKM